MMIFVSCISPILIYSLFGNHFHIAHYRSMARTERFRCSLHPPPPPPFSLSLFSLYLFLCRYINMGNGHSIIRFFNGRSSTSIEGLSLPAQLFFSAHRRRKKYFSAYNRHILCSALISEEWLCMFRRVKALLFIEFFPFHLLCSNSLMLVVESEVM